MKCHGRKLLVLALSALLLTLFTCAPVIENSDKAILLFGFSTPRVLAVVDESTHAITASVPYGTDATTLVADFAATGKSVTIGGVAQASGTTANDFTNPVTYTVTAADSTTQDYTVTVSVSAKDAKAITYLEFASVHVLASIDEGTHCALAVVPDGTVVTGLVATFVTTGVSVRVGAAEQVSGTTANDFTNPVTYIVTAADASTQSYTVTVTPADAKDITTFGFPSLGVTGIINAVNHTIAATVPFGTNAGRLIASFTTNGTSVTVNGVAQVSGTTVNDFSSPVTYVVTSACGTVKQFVATVSIGTSTSLTHIWTRYLALGTEGTDFPGKRADYGMAYAGGSKIALLNGYNGGFVPDFWEYDLGTHTWTQLSLSGTEGTDYPWRRTAFGMTYAGGATVVVFGGNSSIGYAGDTWEWDSSSSTWTQYATGGTAGIDKPGARFSQAMCYMGGTKVLLFGGVNGSAYGDTWVYDISTHAWTQYNGSGTPGTDKPEARYWSGLSYIGNNKALLFAGYYGEPICDDTWIYDLSDHSWTKITISGDNPALRRNHSIAYAGGTLAVMFGGVNNGGSLQDTWVYDTTSSTWTQYNSTGTPETDFPCLRSGHQITGDGAGGMLLFGGNDGTNYRSDTWEYG